MTTHYKKMVLFLIAALSVSLTGCTPDSNDFSATGNEAPEITSEQTVNDTEENPAISAAESQSAEAEEAPAPDTEDTSTSDKKPAPSKEEVLAMRAIALEGMSEEEIARLTENIKIANLQMEEAYMYDDLFGKLEDKEHLYWNYFDAKGDIQIGWAEDGTPVIDYNRFDANNFIELLSDMKSSIQNTALQNDIQYIIDETKLAHETHNVEHANNIYKALHDMDYFLLRYGMEDVGKYTQDTSVVSKYYGVLSIYSAP